MQVIRTMIVVVFMGSLAGIAAGQLDPNDLEKYYGFEEMEIIKLDWGIKDLRVADFNGDGRNDIAIVNNRKAKIALLIQKESFGPEETEVAVDPEDVDINTINPPTRFKREDIAVSQKVLSFVCGDLNSDGLVDLSFYGEPAGLYVILQKAGDIEGQKPGTLSWRTRKKIKIEDGLPTPNALACADLNNDGADDLVLAGSKAVYLIVQKQDGSLAEPVKYATTVRTLGVEVADLNGDNINDLVLVTNDKDKPIHVRLGLETGQLGPQEQLFIEKPWVLEPVNVDGAAGDEILIVDSMSKRLSCYKLAVEKSKDADWPILFYPLTSGEGSTKRDMAVGDFDGDGLEDVTISEPGAAEVVFYRQRETVGLAEPVRFPSFSDITNLSAQDIDGDSRLELAVLSVKEKIIGLSKFEDNRLSFPEPVEIIGEPLAMALADVDSDGGMDCVYISRDAEDVRLLRVVYDLGADTPEKNEEYTADEEIDKLQPDPVLKKLSSNPEGLKVVDVDQDGLQDVLIFVRYENPILVRQISSRQFEVIDSPKSQSSLIKEANLRSIAVADVDGQAGAELLIGQKNFARSLVFAKGQSWNVIDQYNARDTENKVSAVAVFDIEGSDTGQPAILLLDGQKGQLQILTAGQDKTYRFQRELNVGNWDAATHLKMLFAPLTGSDTKSVLLFDSTKFALITPASDVSLPQQLERQFNYETKIKDGAYGNLAAGDINSDGRSDIVMVEYRRNHFEILALDSDFKPMPAMRFKLFEQKSYTQEKRSKSSVEPRELKIADVTGDAKEDLVTVIHDRIIIYPQD